MAKIVGLQLYAPTWQWQPSTTAHDPNPPITLEDAAATATVGRGLIRSVLLAPRRLVSC